MGNAISTDQAWSEFGKLAREVFNDQASYNYRAFENNWLEGEKSQERLDKLKRLRGDYFARMQDVKNKIPGGANKVRFIIKKSSDQYEIKDGVALPCLPGDSIVIAEIDITDFYYQMNNPETGLYDLRDFISGDYRDIFGGLDFP